MSRRVNIMRDLGTVTETEAAGMNDWQSSASVRALEATGVCIFCIFTEMPWLSAVSFTVKIRRAKSIYCQPGTISFPCCCSTKLTWYLVA